MLTYVIKYYVFPFKLTFKILSPILFSKKSAIIVLGFLFSIVSLIQSRVKSCPGKFYSNGFSINIGMWV